jgi:type I restriction enzyme S subunit
MSALPPLPIQRRIAGILSAYDDLIENSQRRIKILEEMARRLYREWFVHFRFPGHEDCQFVESPLGEIPEGWVVKRLADVTTKIGSGATPKGGKGAYKTEGIHLIRVSVQGPGRSTKQSILNRSSPSEYRSCDR